MSRSGVPSPNIAPYLGPVLDQCRSVEYRELGARDLVNRLSGSQMPFGSTVNPYRGCEMGCVYCYARYTHEFLGHTDPAEFEQTIYVKRTDEVSLLGSLRRASSSDAARWAASPRAAPCSQPGSEMWSLFFRCPAG